MMKCGNKLVGNKTYRPFANAEEFKPHRGRALLAAKPLIDPVSPGSLLEYFVFADTGEPCGIEITTSDNEFAAGDWVTIKATGRLAQVCRVLQVGYYEIAFWKDVHRCLTPVHGFEIEKRAIRDTAQSNN